MGLVITNFRGKERKGWNALMFAAERGHLEVVGHLLNAGADTRAKSDVSSSIGCKSLFSVQRISERHLFFLLSRVQQ